MGNKPSGLELALKRMRVPLADFRAFVGVVSEVMDDHTEGLGTLDALMVASLTCDELNELSGDDPAGTTVRMPGVASDAIHDISTACALKIINHALRRYRKFPERIASRVAVLAALKATIAFRRKEYENAQG